MGIYRPRKIRPKPRSFRPTKMRPKVRKKVEEEKSFNLDNPEIPDVTLELNKLEKQYQKKIKSLDQVTDETKTNIQEEIKRLSAEFNQFAEDISAVLKNSSAVLIAELKNKLSEANKELNRAKTIQKGDKGETGKMGKAGTSPSLTEIITRVLSKIRKPKDGKNAIFDEKALRKKFIKQIKKELEVEDIDGLEARLRNIASKVMLGGGGGGQGSDKVKALSGTIDGSNTEFTYSGELPAENSERVILNFQEQNPLVDYTIVASGGTVTVTYTTAPHASLSGVMHIIRYR